MLVSKTYPSRHFKDPRAWGTTYNVVHAKLRPSTRLERSSKGTVVCGNRRCQVCKYLEPGERFTSYRTGKSYTINYELDCNSSNVVYLLSCKVCHAQYVGSTTTKFRLRFNNHKARFRAHSRLSFEGRNKDDLLYRHFFGPGHHGLEDVSIQLIDRVSGEESALRDKESQWAYRLKCIQPQDLNISDFFTARLGRLGLASGESARLFIFLCSACKFFKFVRYHVIMVCKACNGHSP